MRARRLPVGLLSSFYGLAGVVPERVKQPPGVQLTALVAVFALSSALGGFVIALIVVIVVIAATLAVQAVINIANAGPRGATPAINAGDDPLGAVRAFAGAAGGGVYLGLGDNRAWRHARASRRCRCSDRPDLEKTSPMLDQVRCSRLALAPAPQGELADGTGTTREHRSRERSTVTVAARLAGETVPPLAAALVAEETERLDRELADHGGRLSDEQRRAIGWPAAPGRW